VLGPLHRSKGGRRCKGMGWVAGEGGKLRLPVKKNLYKRKGEMATTTRWGPRGEPPFSRRNGV
jgi:hypothetical protein